MIMKWNGCITNVYMLCKIVFLIKTTYFLHQPNSSRGEKLKRETADLSKELASKILLPYLDVHCELRPVQMILKDGSLSTTLPLFDGEEGDFFPRGVKSTLCGSQQ